MNMKKITPHTAGSMRSSLVRVPKTAELVARELRRRIVRGELKEGDNLPPESSLIEEFGISRPTMREAFRILETERLISVSRGSRGGARVHLPDVDVVARYAGLYLQARHTTLADVYEARLLIEPAAVRQLVERRPRTIIEELRNIVQEMDHSINDPEAYSHLAAAFHLKIIEGSGNETLTLLGHVIIHVWEAHLINAVGIRYDVDLAKQGLRSSKKLLDLIEAGDADAAAQHVRRHLERSGKITLRDSGSTSIVEVLS
jgi:GntR family transcriptional regulator, transcriptional repressor for pyruvate dehydrogenase complex